MTAASGAVYAKRSVDNVVSDDRWLMISVEVPSDAREALAEGLFALGGSAIEERGPALATYIRPPADVRAWLEHARTTLSELTGVDALKIDWRWRAGEDWAETWKKGLRPRRVGRRFVVTPSWAQPEITADDLVIVVDPEMAFGTGEHATTRAALRFLEQIVRPGDRVLDVGTGSGILAIGAALLGATDVTGVDHDPDAILNARDNIIRNGVATVVKLEERLVDESYLHAAGHARFDIIVANVLSGMLTPLLGMFAYSLRPGGHLILGGILEEEGDDMLDACSAAGFQVMAEDLEAEWWGVLLQRPSRAAS
jgi:ribosomal protein L11 methyltransferase